MDALYILGTGSKFKNNELRFSLRSLEKHIPTIDRVIVVGEDPGFLSDQVDFYPLPEFDGNKEYCIAKKIEWACKKDVVDSNFLFLNDDFFFLQTINPETYPNYYKGQLDSAGRPNTNYSKSLQDTAIYLKARNKASLHFDVHTPIIYNPQKFMALQQAWNYSKTLKNGLVVKSIYANMYGLDKTAERIKDCKLSRLKNPQDFIKIKNRHVISCSDVGWLRGVSKYVLQQFPMASKYEQQ